MSKDGASCSSDQLEVVVDTSNFARAVADKILNPKISDEAILADLEKLSAAQLLEFYQRRYILGRTIIHMTVSAKRPAVLEKILNLLKNELQEVNFVDEKDRVGSTPLHIAVQLKNISIVKILVKYGANSSIVNGKGFTPLQMCNKDLFLQAAIMTLPQVISRSDNPDAIADLQKKFGNLSLSDRSTDSSLESPSGSSSSPDSASRNLENSADVLYEKLEETRVLLSNLHLSHNEDTMFSVSESVSTLSLSSSSSSSLANSGLVLEEIITHVDVKGMQNYLEQGGSPIAEVASMPLLKKLMLNSLGYYSDHAQRQLYHNSLLQFSLLLNYIDIKTLLSNSNNISSLIKEATTVYKFSIGACQQFFCDITEYLASNLAIARKEMLEELMILYQFWENVIDKVALPAPLSATSHGHSLGTFRLGAQGFEELNGYAVELSDLINQTGLGEIITTHELCGLMNEIKAKIDERVLERNLHLHLISPALEYFKQECIKARDLKFSQQVELSDKKKRKIIKNKIVEGVTSTISWINSTDEFQVANSIQYLKENNKDCVAVTLGLVNSIGAQNIVDVLVGGCVQLSAVEAKIAAKMICSLLVLTINYSNFEISVSIDSVSSLIEMLSSRIINRANKSDFILRYTEIVKLNEKINKYVSANLLIMNTWLENDQFEAMLIDFNQMIKIAAKAPSDICGRFVLNIAHILRTESLELYQSIHISEFSKLNWSRKKLEERQKLSPNIIRQTQYTDNLFCLIIQQIVESEDLVAVSEIFKLWIHIANALLRPSKNLGPDMRSAYIIYLALTSDAMTKLRAVMPALDQTSHAILEGLGEFCTIQDNSMNFRRAEEAYSCPFPHLGLLQSQLTRAYEFNLIPKILSTGTYCLHFIKLQQIYLQHPVVFHSNLKQVLSRMSLNREALESKIYQFFPFEIVLREPAVVIDDIDKCIQYNIKPHFILRNSQGVREKVKDEHALPELAEFISNMIRQNRLALNEGLVAFDRFAEYYYRITGNNTKLTAKLHEKYPPPLEFKYTLYNFTHFDIALHDLSAIFKDLEESVRHNVVSHFISFGADKVGIRPENVLPELAEFISNMIRQKRLALNEGLIAFDSFAEYYYRITRDNTKLTAKLHEKYPPPLEFKYTLYNFTHFDIGLHDLSAIFKDLEESVRHNVVSHFVSFGADKVGIRPENVLPELAEFISNMIRQNRLSLNEGLVAFDRFAEHYSRIIINNTKLAAKVYEKYPPPVEFNNTLYSFTYFDIALHDLSVIFKDLEESVRHNVVPHFIFFGADRVGIRPENVLPKLAEFISNLIRQNRLSLNEGLVAFERFSEHSYSLVPGGENLKDDFKQKYLLPAEFKYALYWFVPFEIFLSDLPVIFRSPNEKMQRDMMSLLILPGANGIKIKPENALFELFKFIFMQIKFNQVELKKGLEIFTTFGEHYNALFLGKHSQYGRADVENELRDVYRYIFKYDKILTDTQSLSVSNVTSLMSSVTSSVNSVTSSPSSVTSSTGSVTSSTGSVISSTGSVISSTGSVISSTGSVIFPSGSVISSTDSATSSASCEDALVISDVPANNNQQSPDRAFLARKLQLFFNFAEKYYTLIINDGTEYKRAAIANHWQTDVLSEMIDVPRFKSESRSHKSKSKFKSKFKSHKSRKIIPSEVDMPPNFNDSSEVSTTLSEMLNNNSSSDIATMTVCRAYNPLYFMSVKKKDIESPLIASSEKRNSASSSSSSNLDPAPKPDFGSSLGKPQETRGRSKTSSSSGDKPPRKHSRGPAKLLNMVVRPSFN